MRDLGISDDDSYAYGINDFDHIVGYYGICPMVAFICDDSFIRHNINDLLASKFSNWYVYDAYDINNKGHIVAKALSPERNDCIVILTPITP